MSLFKDFLSKHAFATPVLPRSFTNVKSGKLGTWKVGGTICHLWYLLGMQFMNRLVSNTQDSVSSPANPRRDLLNGWRYTITQCFIDTHWILGTFRIFKRTEERRERKTFVDYNLFSEEIRGIVYRKESIIYVCAFYWSRWKSKRVLWKCMFILSFLFRVKYAIRYPCDLLIRQIMSSGIQAKFLSRRPLAEYCP